MSRLPFRRAANRVIGMSVAVCAALAQCPITYAQSAAAPQNLNLSSVSRTESAPGELTSPVFIRNGATTQAVSAGMNLTPAQAVAVQQILQSGTQSILLGVGGNAVGGNLAFAASQNISSMTIPRGVSVLGDFTSGQAAAVTGNLFNAGTLYAFSTSGLSTNAVLQANNITNAAGSLISSVLPAGGLPGVANAINNLNLALIANLNLTNAGTISSAGDLTVLAGNQIVNSGSGASLLATNNLNLLSSSIVNQGVLSSQLANINLAVPGMYSATVNQLGLGLAPNLSEAVNINGTGGVIQAQNGAINIGGPGFSSKAVLSILNGSLTAPVINFDAGAGSVQGLLDSMVGTVNVAGGLAQVGSRTGSLRLGNIKIDGDPTFFSTGNIDIVGDISVQENLAILAGGNITAAAKREITAIDGTGQGHDIYMVAGAKFAPSGATQSPTVPGTQIASGQLVTVIGASTTGGSISLADSVLDTRSGGAGDKSGGKVTLVAYAGTGTGGIGNLSILTGGTGAGKNGAVLLIAGGELTPNVAIDRVQVTAAGGGSKAGAAVKFFAATPVGSASFDSTGKALGDFTAGTPTARDIQVNLPVATDSGDIIVDTAGNVFVANSLIATDPVIISSGASAGRDAGNITINSGSIIVQSPIVANGFNGANGANGLAGLPGAFGSAGGSGGDITLVGKNGIVIDANIRADGGLGGKGGNGGDGPADKVGGAGGNGGKGGMAGSISLVTENTQITQNAPFLVTALGGSGGDGGNGGAGGISASGRAGGAGGSAGIAAKGGMITAKSGIGDLLLSGVFDASGGHGGDGGAGGEGGAGTSRGGVGGNTGISSDGADGGSISLSTTSGQINFSSGIVAGGDGGVTGSSGAGGTGATGGKGGLASDSGDGGDGGRIALISTTGAITLQSSLDMSGGFGGDLVNDAGDGGTGTTLGGNGGNMLGGGNGGGGGQLQAKTKGAITTFATIDATGGVGGTVSAFAGAGGDGNTGGVGGSTGAAGDGGKGGSVSLTSTQANPFSVNASIDVSGGNGGLSEATAGVGGQGLSTKGGTGGSLGIGGDGGAGGAITLSSEADMVVAADLRAFGGTGGEVNGDAGNGGDGAGPIGGVGGKVGDAGAGGDGGRINIEANTNINVLNINASGGTGGGQFGTAGKGGDGNVGAVGGSVGVSGGGGKGGMLTIKTSQLAPGPATITIDNASIDVNGGLSGLYAANGGDGGNGVNGIGGAGGSLGNQGSGGDGGKIFLTGFQLLITPTGSVHANGGASSGYGDGISTSGNGGNAGNNGKGGNGGSVGFAGSGGDGGLIQISVKDTMQIDNGGGASDTIAARGGHVFDNLARSGKGGDGSGNGGGGNGGNILFNGSAGGGGSISITGDSGDLTGIAIIAAAGAQVGNVFSVSGGGGNAGAKGKGGSSGSIGNNGNGGKGGSITANTKSGAILINPMFVVGSDVNGTFSPRTGDGGKGGTVSGDGGSSGSIGNNGSGGNGGSITLISTTGDVGPPGNLSGPYLAHAGIIAPAFPITGNGGDAATGNGGDSGSIGNNGKAGNGGVVTLTTYSGTVNVPKGTIGAAGADGGLFGAITGNGGASTIKGSGGDSGSIGKNSNGGDAGLVKLSSFTGSIIVNGGIVIPGGIGNGNISRTGNGGAAASGNGGRSGDIFDGGNGGKGGTLEAVSGGDFVSSELVNAAGGNAAVLTYMPITGNGGNGTSAGGASGSIFAAGTAGAGGSIDISTTSGDVNPDRLLVDGGAAGDSLGLFPGSMQGRTGNGGSGLIAGGSAGSVGDAVTGGNAGKISVFAGKSILQSVFYKGNGGIGGDQAGIGGRGGDGGARGGRGGSVGASGAGGWGGSIALTANLGPEINIKEMTAFGGDAGSNNGAAGNGGDATIGGGAGGAGGSLGDSGEGGVGGSLFARIINKAGVPVNVSVTGNIGLNFYGGNGGAMLGTAGNGGAGLLDNAGGAGGSAGTAGGGGDGGSLKFKVPSGDLNLIDSSVNGGRSGGYFATAGNGGSASSTEDGGAGGSVGFQKDGGAGGSVKFEGGKLVIQNGLLTANVTADGGAAYLYEGTAGNGGQGGGDGGDGGKVGSAGGGGVGGSVSILAATSILVDGILSANGGKRFSITQTAGNGGNAGALGGRGGRGGDISGSGSGGVGGGIAMRTLISQVTGTGSIEAVGGDAEGVTMIAGSGGNGTVTSQGGDGGATGRGPGGGKGGMIGIDAAGNISLVTSRVYGGAISGAFAATGGNGGNAGASAGKGGAGGAVNSAGDAGDGGRIELKSLVGTISAFSLQAMGGSSNTFNAQSGNGGSQNNSNGDGGVGGAVGSNGSGGKGGTIEISTLGMIQSSGEWNVSGGSVGDYNGISGNGGNGAPAAGKIAGGAGGIGGRVTDNGKAGGGGGMKLKGEDLALTFGDTLRADGGSVGTYNGLGGNGGTGGASGGDGAGTGSNGGAGVGGSISIETSSGDITTQLISTVGGNVGDYQGVGGVGGTSGKTGGAGGAAGTGAAGGGGGSISLSSDFGAITVNADLLAYGTVGGTNHGEGGDGGTGVSKGGAGGNVGFAGSGGQGGFITVEADKAVVITGVVNASKGAGGAQFGIGGNGGDATITLATTDQGVGGDGGTVGASGTAGSVGLFGAANGKISIVSKGLDVTVNGDILAVGALGGANFGSAGFGGNALKKGGAGGVIAVAGNGARGGTITLEAQSGAITTNGLVSADGGAGGEQQGTGGAGGSASGTTGIGGKGGSVEKAGNGGNGGVITLDSTNTTTLIPPTVFGGPGGLQSGIAGPGGAGATPGTPGSLGPAGTPGIDGTINITYDPLTEDDIDSHDLKKRKRNSTFIALDSEFAIYSDVAEATAYKAVGHVEITPRLWKGTKFFAPTANQTLRTAHGVVSIAAGSKVIIEATNQATLIRTLHNRKASDVMFVSEDSNIEVGIGHQLVVSDSLYKAPRSSNVSSKIGVRNAVTHALAGGLTARISEYSIMSALVADGTLQALYKSTDAADRKHFNQIAKNACILHTITIPKGAYKMQ